MAKVKTGPKTKRKGGGVPAKAKAVEGLQRDLESSTAIIVTEYRGLKANYIESVYLTSTQGPSVKVDLGAATALAGRATI